MKGLKGSLLLFIWVLAIFLGVFVGQEGLISPLTESDVDKIILFDLRLPRVFMGLCAGAILGLTGLVFQNLFRNDLASPYTLGVSAGAAFGASLAITLTGYLGITFSINFLSMGVTGLFAFLGALLTIFIIYLIARTKWSFHPHLLLLSGVVASFFFSSCIVFLHFINDSFNTKKIIQWTLGDLSVVGYEAFGLLIPLTFMTLIYLNKRSLALNTLAIGDTFAIARGLNIERFRLEVFVLLSLAVSLVISFSGPIAFIGLIVPHLVKKLWGVDFKEALFPTFLASGAFLVLCDLVSQVLMAGLVLPVGVVTSFLGGPFFLFLILRKKDLS